MLTNQLSCSKIQIFGAPKPKTCHMVNLSRLHPTSIHTTNDLHELHFCIFLTAVSWSPMRLTFQSFLQTLIFCLAYSALKLEAIVSSETSVDFLDDYAALCSRRQYSLLKHCQHSWRRSLRVNTWDYNRPPSFIVAFITANLFLSWNTTSRK
jgi:hypothetical protein